MRASAAESFSAAPIFGASWMNRADCSWSSGFGFAGIYAALFPKESNGFYMLRIAFPCSVYT